MTADSSSTKTRHSTADLPTEYRQTTDNEPTIYRHPSVARAHDYDNDYDDSIVDDGIDAPYLEEELLVKYKAEYIRTPVNETCVFQNAEYKGVHRVRNLKFKYGYRAHIWLVDFLRVDSKEYDEPLRGLLQITVKGWRKAEQSDPRHVFNGVCTLKADKRRQMKWVKTKPGGIL